MIPTDFFLHHYGYSLHFNILFAHKYIAMVATNGTPRILGYDVAFALLVVGKTHESHAMVVGGGAEFESLLTQGGSVGYGFVVVILIIESCDTALHIKTLFADVALPAYWNSLS